MRTWERRTYGLGKRIGRGAGGNRKYIGWLECDDATRDSIRDARGHAIQVFVLFDGNAGDFNGDGRRSGGAELADWGGLRGVWRASELLREQRLHGVAELATELQKRGLRLVPRNQTGGIGKWWQV